MSGVLNVMLGLGASVRTLGSSFSLSSAFGDMTANGGNAAAIDGTTNQAATASSAKTGTNLFAYAGGVAASPKRIYKAILYGSNNQGFEGVGNPSVTLDLYGKNGSNPSSSTDGTLLGTLTFTDTANESAGREIESTDKESLYDRVWLRVSVGSAGALRIAEVVPYEAV